MKREIIPPSRKFLIVYRVVVALIIALVLVLVAGSFYAVIRPPDSGPLFRIGGKGNRGPGIQGGGSGNRSAGALYPDERTAVFSGIGRLRIPVNGAATVILSVSFPYPSNDRPFAEELASRVGEFRSIATGYFSTLPEEKIARLDEEAAKTEILKSYNSLLRLGKIETLYFTDLMVIE